MTFSSSTPDALFLGASSSLKSLDRPLSVVLSQHLSLAYWEYAQSPDEPCSLDPALVLLYDFLKGRRDPIHLIGHGLAGVMGMLFAQRYPERVRSLTLLAVAAQPGLTWHAHYYVQRKLIPCSREQLLIHTVKNLLGDHVGRQRTRWFAEGLGKDLDASPTPHSLVSISALPERQVLVPLLICGSQNDPVVDPVVQERWRGWLKPEDRLWNCPDGRHFFHYYYPQTVAAQVVQFWQGVTGQEVRKEGIPALSA